MMQSIPHVFANYLSDDGPSFIATAAAAIRSYKYAAFSLTPPPPPDKIF